MKPLVGALVLLCLIVILGIQIFLSFKDAGRLSEESSSLQAQLEKVRSDNQKLQQELDYLKNPENLEKELKARFNYRREGEKMIIIVPPAASGTQP